VKAKNPAHSVKEVGSVWLDKGIIVSCLPSCFRDWFWVIS